MTDISVFAAGSLRAVLADILSAFAARTGEVVAPRHGPAGLLRERIEAGDRCDLFMSANLEHPARLEEAGLAGPVTLFARNSLRALARGSLDIRDENFAAVLLDPAIRIGTSTPIKDPSGDYAWRLFRNIDRERAGAFEILDAKAIKLVGGAEPVVGAASYGPVADALNRGDIDVFLGYRTGMAALMRDAPGAREIALPAAHAVDAPYGLTTLRDAAPGAYRLAAFVMSIPAQSILQRHGFRPVALPEDAATG